MPVALISTSTSPAFGPSRRTASTDRGCPALWATAARVSIQRLRIVEARPGLADPHYSGALPRAGSARAHTGWRFIGGSAEFYGGGENIAAAADGLDQAW